MPQRSTSADQRTRSRAPHAPDAEGPLADPVLRRLREKRRQTKIAERYLFYALLVVFVIVAAFFGANRAGAATWGEYPNCIAPAIPLESHDWWLEEGERFPRHLHSGSCVPNARTFDGSLVRVQQRATVDLRIVAFNNPDEINWSRVQWVGDTYERTDRDFRCTPSDPSYERVGDAALPQCTWRVEHLLDPFASDAGMQELRITPNISDNVFGKRQFTSAKYEVWTFGDDHGSRNEPWPRMTGWYEGFEYCGATVGITELFNGASDLGKTKPLVSGTVSIPVDHDKCEGSGTKKSVAWLDTSFHLHPDFWEEPLPPPGVFHQFGGKLLYARDGMWEGDLVLDTSDLCDGEHTLYVQSQHERAGEGLHAGALKVHFDTANGNEACDGSPPPPPPDGRKLREFFRDFCQVNECPPPYCGLLGIELVPLIWYARRRRSR